MTSDEIEASVSTLSNAAFTLDGRVSDLKGQISELKEKIEKPKTPMGNFKEYAGIVSLVLGLVISSFTIYDSTVAKPAIAREAQAAARDAQHLSLENTLASIMSLQQDFLKAQAENASPEVLSTLAGKLGYMVDVADKITANQKGLTSFRDEISLAEVCEGAGRTDEATLHYETALSLAKSPNEKAEAEAKGATLECQLGKQKDAKEKFDDAIKLIEVVKDPPIQILLSQVYFNRALCECYAGELSAGNQSRNSAYKIMDHILDSVPSSVQSQLRGARKSMEQQWASTPCGATGSMQIPNAPAKE
jgi:tetratricopeptide (TPR) repeat protein